MKMAMVSADDSSLQADVAVWSRFTGCAYTCWA